MIAIAVVVSLPFVVILLTRPVLRRLALRNAVRRPRESLLVVIGSLLATALITAAFVVGDTLDASLRANSYTQLGPIDEVVSTPLAQSAQLDRVAAITSPDIDGVLRVVTSGASAAVVDGSGVARSAAPKAQLVETDFIKGRMFGGDPSVTGVSGATPAPGTAVITEPLATRLGVRPGSRFTAYAFGNAVDLRVDRIVPQNGVAGWWNGPELTSYNAFVAPGTIEKLATDAKVAAAPPQSMVLVSNTGGIEDGAQRTDAVRRELQGALNGVAATVEPVKRDALDFASQAGKSLTQLYQFLGFFAVAAGILLLINIFRMLGEERRSELGMLRAMGMKRRALVGAFASEGWLYAVVASAFGVVVGLGVGRLVITGAQRNFNQRDADFRLPIRFNFETQSLLVGFTIGLVIAMVTILATSVAISRFNVIAAIRDLDAEKRPRRQRWVLMLWSLGALAGVMVLVAGIAGSAIVPMAIGGALIALCARFGLRGRVPERPLVTVTALFALVWGIAAVPVAAWLGGALEIPGFIVQGVVVVVAAVVLVNEYQHEIGGALSRLSGGRLSVRLGLAYPLAKRGRTALTLGQFAIVVFILAYLSTLVAMFGSQLDTATAKLGGGANVFVESNRANPVPFTELARTLGAQKVAPIVSEIADVTPPGKTRPEKALMAGYDESLLQIGPPKLSDRGRFATDAEAYRYVLTHPNTAMVDHFFLSRGAGPPDSQVGIGDTMTLTDPVTGKSQKVEIVAKSADDWLFNGGLTSAATLRGIYGASAVPSRAYIRAADATKFARALDARYYAQGAKADPIRSLVEQRLSRQLQFFTLMRAFLAVGLIIGVAGIGVIMVRAVRERRRQVGVLRALGFPAAQVSNAFAVEALFVAFEGVLVGIALGFVCTWSLTLSSSFGEGLTFRIPWTAVAVLMAGTLVGALVATLGPAYAASKIRPAVALRITD